MLTASGALWGFLSILAIFEQNWRAAVLQYPNVPLWVIWGSFAYIAYYVVLSFLPQKASTQP